MTAGKIGTAPCGHRGEAVVGQYYRCTEGCEDLSDGVPRETEDERTLPLCANCGSSKVQVWPDFVINGNSLWHCDNCHQSFQS